MARTFNIPTQTRPAGVYGPFSVDSFTSANTDRLVLTLTASGAWPTADPMLRIDMAWSNGTTWSDTIPGPQPNNPLTWALGIPKVGDGKVAVVSGQITITTFVATTCGGSLQAV